jgi:hypothetical protein
VDQSINSWSPTSPRVQRLWAALTGDTLTAAPSWAAYSDGIQWRHDFVHRAATVSEQQAEQFLTAADQLMGHMADVLAASFSAPS